MQVLKFGGSVLTNKAGFMEADSGNIKSLAGMLGRAWKNGLRSLILIHGAGSFGHPLVEKYGLHGKISTPAQKEGVEKTHSACVSLCMMLVGALEGEGVPAVPLHPYDLGKLKNGRISSFDREKVETALKEGSLPVLHGDMMPDSELGYGVCSGDQLVSYFGKDAEGVIFGTNVDGVLNDEGKLIESINAGNFGEISKHFKKPEYADVTGGMEGKIREIMEIGRPAYVANALFPERVEALLEGRDTPCTRIN
jgi:isopentenyl phosphate kinase